MIAKKYRIPRQEISYILNSGETLNTKLFIIRFRKSNEKFFRYRAIISKKLDKEAVKRNYLRRQIYETIRQNASEANNNNFDLILIPKKIILSAKFQEITSDVKNIIKKVNGEA